MNGVNERIKKLKFELRDSEKGEILLLGRMDKNVRIYIVVKDNGSSIPAELKDKIFIPFFTAKESGSGIGLRLSLQIMLMHGGCLKILSEQGKLTEAVLEF